MDVVDAAASWIGAACGIGLGAVLFRFADPRRYGWVGSPPGSIATVTELLSRRRPPN